MLIPVNGDLPHDARVWIFGYASLIWKPGFKYQRRVLGYIKGFARRFWQTNSTHRGTPDQPGRVATLVPDHDESTVWGLAYEVVGEENIRHAMKHLNGREVLCGGYCLMLVDFHPVGETEVTMPILAFTATETNQHYSTTSLRELAHQVVAAKGPAGHNVEYVFRIVDFMREHVGCGEDMHLWELDALIRTILREKDMVLKNLIGEGPICDCDYKSIVRHRRNCSTNQWALHKKDILRTVTAAQHKKYTDLSEFIVRAFSTGLTIHEYSPVFSGREGKDSDFQKHQKTTDESERQRSV